MQGSTTKTIREDVIKCKLVKEVSLDLRMLIQNMTQPGGPRDCQAFTYNVTVGNLDPYEGRACQGAKDGGREAKSVIVHPTAARRAMCIAVTGKSSLLRAGELHHLPNASHLWL